MSVLKVLLATPLMWVWYLIFIAVIVLRKARKDKRARIGWHALFFGFILFTLLSFRPAADLLARPLLGRYTPSPEALNNLDVITVLGGGGEDGVPSEATKQRIVEGVGLFEKSKAKFLAVQGASESDGEVTDGQIMKRIALEKRIPEEKILLDSRSKTTAEHPYQLDMLLPPGSTRIGIVTSAIHMPRAMKIFENYFTDKILVALPVDAPIGKPHYQLVDMIPSVDAFSSNTATLHEWVGIVWYKMRY